MSRHRTALVLTATIVFASVVAGTPASHAESTGTPTFYLRNSNTSGVADIAFPFGNADDVPLVGDWNGDGRDTVGVHRGNAFYLHNSNAPGAADVTFTFGDPGDIPVVGDWNGDGTDTIGVYRGNAFYLRNSNTSGVADVVLTFGDPGDIPLVGDWNGDGTDTIGVSRGGTFYLRNTNTSGPAGVSFAYGDPGDVPIVGDWNGDGTDTVGVTRGATFYLRNTNTTGRADVTALFGDPTDVPLSGDWNGDGTDTIGVVRLPPLPHPFDPYRGLGTWADVFDWSYTYAPNPPPFTLAAVDHMADVGVQTLYLQGAHAEDDTDVLERGRLEAIITRAHLRGLRVVGWYLPDLTDIDNDLRHLLAIAQLRVDGLAVDIESSSVRDVSARNTALIALSDRLRARLPDWVLSAIVPAPVALDEIPTGYWPNFPWMQLANDYDLWQPMSYWTFRSEPWRDAFAYTTGNIDRIRSHIGQPRAIVHPIGGIADGTTVDDVDGLERACAQRGCIGASLYDYETTDDSLWPDLRALRSG